MAKTLKKMILNWEVYDVGYDSQITIQKNWTDVDSFTLNQSSAKTINISVPTNSDYVDKTSAQSVWGVKTFTSAPVVPSKTTAAANSWTAVATEAQVYAVAQTVPSVDSSVSSSSTNPVQNKVIKQYVDDAVWAVTGIDFQIVETLPVTWTKWVIYLVANGWTGTNSYDEYIWITSSSSYEKIWTTEVDLSDYVTLATAQTISWTKTFSAEPVLPSKTTAATNSWTKPATEAQVKTVADAIPTVNNATLTIIKANSTVTINDIVFDYGGTGSITVNYTNALGINASVIGQPQAVVDVVNNTIIVSGLNAGTYILSVTTVVGEDYNPVTQTANITVNKAKTVLTANAVTTVYNVNKYLTITLKDVCGNPLKDVEVGVNFNGVKYLTTDKNGQIKIPTKVVSPNKYNVKITFDGNANYLKSSTSSKVVIKKASSKITAAKKTFKAKTKVKKYAVVLKDITNSPIINAKLTLKVKGKTYSAKTNYKGKAVFKITKLNKKGTYKAVIKFNGNKYYLKSTKNTKITVKASKTTFKTVSQGSKDTKTVKKIQQALKDHGYYLSYKGHYLKVDGKYESCTSRSVKEFQHDKGLKVTGKVDEKTAHKLGII